MRVSEFYSLHLTQPSLDFIDVDLDSDAQLFVDPTALNLLDTEWGSECRYLIKTYFSHILNCVKNGNHNEAKVLLSALSEPNETHLGLSREKPRGRGVGDELAHKIWSALSQSSAVHTGLISDLEDTALMIDGIASDIISDITTNLIREPLLNYTAEMARQNNIPLETRSSKKIWDAQAKRWTTKEIQQIIVTSYNRQQQLMLVPKSIVRRSISYNAGEYFNKYILCQLQEEDARNGLMRILKNGETRLPTKKSIKERLKKTAGGKINIKTQNTELTLSRPELLQQYKDESARNPKSPLNHNALAQQLGTPTPDWEGLLANLTDVNAGVDDARLYEKAVLALFNALFSPWLTYPIPQTRINSGRKIIDITYTNVAQDGFFKWVKENYTAPFIFVECKNYSTDIGNPELDQLAGRFSPSRGKVGILVSRKLTDKETIYASCRDTARDDRGYIIALDDDDLASLTNTAETQPAAERLNLLRERFNALVL